MKRLAILGASGHGGVVADVAELRGWIVTFFDDAYPEKEEVGHWKVKGGSDFLLKSLDQFDGHIVAIGNNQARLEKTLLLEKVGAKVVSLIHPSAIVSKYATIDTGTVIMANAVVNSFSRVGKANIVNTSAIVEHDCVLKNGVHISPGAQLAGGVVVNERAWIGIGATIKQTLVIGNNTIVGAGAVVVSNILANKTVVGIPAK